MSFELRKRWAQAGGVIPDDWNIVSLESLLLDSKSIAVGVMYPGPDTLGGTPLIKVGDIKGGLIIQKPSYLISNETNEEHKRTQLKGDELLITLVGNPGECVVVQPHMAGWNPARAIAVIRLKNPKLRIYLKTVLESSAGKHLIDAVLNTTVQKTLNLKDIRQLPIPMPDEETIKSISSFSEALTNRIALLRETNTTLESIAQALFKSWFVDFDPVHANAGTQTPSLPPEIQSLFPSTFVESSLGLVPVGWDIGSLEDLLVLQRGFDLPSIERKEGNYLIIAASGPSGTHEKAMAKGPGVVTGRSGVLGKVFFTLDDYWPLNTTLWIKEFRRASPCFAFEILSRLDLLSFNAGSAVPSLNRNHIHGLPYLLPPRNLVDEFESAAMLMRQQMAANNKRIENLSALRDTLLPRLISGQLRLPEVEELIEESA